jgi:hypothetical protein
MYQLKLQQDGQLVSSTPGKEDRPLWSNGVVRPGRAPFRLTIQCNNTLPYLEERDALGSVVWVTDSNSAALGQRLADGGLLNDLAAAGAGLGQTPRTISTSAPPLLLARGPGGVPGGANGTAGGTGAYKGNSTGTGSGAGNTTSLVIGTGNGTLAGGSTGTLPGKNSTAPSGSTRPPGGATLSELAGVATSGMSGQPGRLPSPPPPPPQHAGWPLNPVYNIPDRPQSLLYLNNGDIRVGPMCQGSQCRVVRSTLAIWLCAESAGRRQWAKPCADPRTPWVYWDQHSVAAGWLRHVAGRGDRASQQEHCPRAQHGQRVGPEQARSNDILRGPG